MNKNLLCFSKFNLAFGKWRCPLQVWLGKLWPMSKKNNFMTHDLDLILEGARQEVI